MCSSDLCPINQAIDPIELDHETFGLDTASTLATMGIFNPTGPSVGSLEVAIHYRIGAALVLERLRHPHHPSIRVHAVLDRDGFENLDQVLEDVVGQLAWSNFDWWDMRNASEQDSIAMARGLRKFAERRPDFDFERLALGLIENLRDPWARVDQSYEPSIEIGRAHV